MIIPIRCYTCGKPIAHLWNKYNEQLQLERNKELRNNNDGIVAANNRINLINLSDSNNKEIEGEILDTLHITKYCCRRMFIAQVDIFDKL